MNTSRTLAPPKDASTHLSPATSAFDDLDAAEPAHETDSNGYSHSTGDFHPSETEGDSTLSSIEREELRRLEALVRRETVSFRLASTALLKIQRRKNLYRRSHGTFEAYCREKFGFSRAHAYRLIDAAETIERVSPMGDILGEPEMCPTGHIASDPLALFVTERHFRPLSRLSQERQDEVIELVNAWASLAEAKAFTSNVVSSAASLLSEPMGQGEPPSNELVRKIRALLSSEKARAASNRNRGVTSVLERIADQVNTLIHQNCPKREWRLIEQRHLLKPPGGNGKGGKFRIKFDELGAPLQRRIPTIFRVDAGPDLFGEAVPDEFLRLVFQVMKKAHWHRFLLATGNLERARLFWQQAGSPQNVKLGADEGRIS